MQIISVDELNRRMKADEKLNLIDCREPHENAAFNIGGILVPLGKIQTTQLQDMDALRDEEVIVYCRSGNRSGQACLFLDSQGFKDTWNLEGGMLAWQERFGSL